MHQLQPPIAISIKLASLIFPGVPKLNAAGLINAEIATNTAAKPTKLWKPATNSGIAVIGIRYNKCSNTSTNC